MASAPLRGRGTSACFFGSGAMLSIGGFWGSSNLTLRVVQVVFNKAGLWPWLLLVRFSRVSKWSNWFPSVFLIVH